MVERDLAVGKRLVSLDAFRGFAIAGMLFVNNPGTWNPEVVPAQLLHAEWHGCTFADLIFPFFLFIVGVAMPFSDSRRIEKGIPFGKSVLVAGRRAVVLYLLGAFLVSAGLNRPVLYFGILQRIAVLYLFAFLVLRWNWRYQAVLAGAALLVWWGFMLWGEGPGVVSGSFERDQNFAQYIDRMILPEGNLETVFSLIPGLATVLFGVLVGRFLLVCREPRRVISVLGAAAAGGILFGLLWQVWVPLNKILWSSSFAVYAGGWSCAVLLLFYWMVEVRGWRKPVFPFVVFGMNAIALYMAAGFLARWVMLSWKVSFEGEPVLLTAFFYRTFASWTNPVVGSVLYSTLFMLILFALGLWMYRRGLFLKV